jgi:hypothetical protein
MYGACSTDGTEEKYILLFRQNPEEKDHWEDLDKHQRIILKRQGVKVRTGFSCFQIRRSERGAELCGIFLDWLNDYQLLQPYWLRRVLLHTTATYDAFCRSCTRKLLIACESHDKGLM